MPKTDEKSMVKRKVYGKNEYRLVDPQVIRWQKRRREALRLERERVQKEAQAQKEARGIWNVFYPEEK